MEKLFPKRESLWTESGTNKPFPSHRFTIRPVAKISRENQVELFRFRLESNHPATRASFISFFERTGDGKRGSAQICFNVWSRRSPNSWANHSGLLSSNWFFECEHQLLREADGRNWALGKTWRRHYGPVVSPWYVYGLGSKLNLARFVRSLFSVQSIQLFRQRLSYKSVIAYATMPIGIMGSKSLALLYWGPWCWERRQEKLWIHGFVLFPSTRWNTLSFNHATVKPPLPIITFGIVA